MYSKPVRFLETSQVDHCFIDLKAAIKTKMKKFIIFIKLAFPVIALSQVASIPHDTSFTVYGTFIKEQKKFPFIKIANPPVPTNIFIDSNKVYHTINGRELHADIFYPKVKNKKGYPGVVLIHGGGWRSGDRTQTIPIARQLAAKGYVTVAVEYRLSIEAIYPASVVDIKTLIAWLRSHAGEYHLDRSRIATVGFSSGGQLSALIGTTNGFLPFADASNDS